MIHFFLKLLVIVVMLTLTSCSNKDFTEALERVRFDGISAAQLTEKNRQLMLKWERPSSGAADYYAVFLKNLGPTDKPEGTIIPLNLSQDQMPAISGEQISIVHKEEIALPLKLDGGSLYAIQVRAFAKNNSDQNTIVFGFVPADTAQITPSSAFAENIMAVGGNYQTGNISSIFATPLKAKLRNGIKPLINEIITFSISTGIGASISAASATTDANGEASTIFTAGSSLGTYVVSASWNSGQVIADFELTAVDPASAYSLTIVSGNVQLGGISTAFPNTLQVRLMH